MFRSSRDILERADEGDSAVDESSNETGGEHGETAGVSAEVGISNWWSPPISKAFVLIGDLAFRL